MIHGAQDPRGMDAGLFYRSWRYDFEELKLKAERELVQSGIECVTRKLLMNFTC